MPSSVEAIEGRACELAHMPGPIESLSGEAATEAIEGRMCERTVAGVGGGG
jgi:hypothetical protein